MKARIITISYSTLNQLQNNHDNLEYMLAVNYKIACMEGFANFYNLNLKHTVFTLCSSYLYIQNDTYGFHNE